jgi:hypothetical protein
VRIGGRYIFLARTQRFLSNSPSFGQYWRTRIDFPTINPCQFPKSPFSRNQEITDPPLISDRITLQGVPSGGGGVRSTMTTPTRG